MEQLSRATRTRAYLPAATAAREQAHRRALFIGIAAFILLGVSPVVGHHLSRGAETLFRGTDHLGDICLVALHALLAPIHGSFHVALIAGLAYAAWDRLRAWRAARAVLGQLEARSPRAADPFWLAATDVGLDPSAVRIVDGLPNPAFTVGWMRPRVYLAASLERRLTGPELRAVLAHEGAHVARRDPLRLGVFRLFACTLFWIPMLRRLAADFADESEVQADDVAARRDPLSVASAILSMAAWSKASEEPNLGPPTGALGFIRGVSRVARSTCGHRGAHSPAQSPRDLVERRVRRLAGEDTAVGTHVTRRSLAGALSMLVLVWLSGAIMAHPLDAAAAARNPASPASHAPPSVARGFTACERHELPAIEHLFCKPLVLADGRVYCPHQHG